MPRLLAPLTLVVLSLHLCPADVFAEPPAARPLTLEQLGELFKKLDCEVKPIENAHGMRIGYEGVYRSRQSGSAFAVKALLAGDGSTVWLLAPLEKITDLEGVPAEIFVKLLAANRRIAPASFAYRDVDCRLYLQMPAYGLGLTAGGLEQQLERLGQTRQATAALWRTDGWPKRPDPASETMK